MSDLCDVIAGPASPGQGSSHWSEERGEGPAAVHCEQRGGEDIGRSEIQAER